MTGKIQWSRSKLVQANETEVFCENIKFDSFSKNQRERALVNIKLTIIILFPLQFKVNIWRDLHS